MMNISVAFIGAVGVPNIYGGFEMFLESCAPTLLSRFNRILVTCDKARYASRDSKWQGVERVFIPVGANGASSVFHDLFAFLAVFFRANVIIVLGVSGGAFFPLFRLLCFLSNKKLIVNVDGIEWRRAKFSRSKRAFLYVSDRLAQFFAHAVVVDNEALRPFLLRSVKDSAVSIAYPGDHVKRVMLTGESGEGAHFLTICRIEPENNCHVLIAAFQRLGRGRYDFIGNWSASQYGTQLREKYKNVPGLNMQDPLYDPEILATLREGCTTYLHGHSVGGTNPSLVEMLFYDCPVIAFDCTFNRCTAGDAIMYFADEGDLVRQIADLTVECPNRDDVRRRYTRHRICGQYARLISDLFGVTERDEMGEAQPIKEADWDFVPKQRGSEPRPSGD